MFSSKFGQQLLKEKYGFTSQMLHYVHQLVAIFVSLVFGGQVAHLLCLETMLLRAIQNIKVAGY